MKWCSERVPLTGMEAGVVGVCPASSEDRPRWFVATRDGRVRGLDFDDGSVFFEAQLAFGFDEAMQATLVASADGRYLAVVQRTGVEGALYEVGPGRVLSPLARGDYHANVSAWALALVRHEGRDVLITATGWNRLEAWELPSLRRLAPTSDESSLDYFWGHVSPSADGLRLASFGWFWQPVGAVRSVDVAAWLSTGVDPPPEPQPAQFADWWDDPVCWLDEGHLAMQGQAAPEDDMFGTAEGVAVLDLATHAVQRFFPGLSPSELAFDGTHLLSLGKQAHCLSLENGKVLAVLERATHAWHPGARVALSIPSGEGEDTAFGLHWLTGGLGAMPRLPTTARREDLLVLADALEEQGRAGEAVAHCRAGGAHGRRCWVLEGLR